jgi:predicted outer membrane repeat protein
LPVALATIVLVAAVSGVLAPAAGAKPAEVTVTNCDSAGPGSLRDAVASADPGATIVFATACPAGATQVNLAGSIALTKDVRIKNADPAQMVLSGQADRIFTVAAGVTAKIEGVTIQGGVHGFGGGVYNAGKLTLENSVVRNNTAFVANVAERLGGGIYNDGGELRVKHSMVVQNTAGGAGGIENAGGKVTVDRSTIADNASFSAGGIGNSGDLKVKHSTLSGNEADFGGAILTSGKAEIDGSVITDNATFEGAAIGGSGTITIKHSTLSDNRAFLGNGGGVHIVDGTLAIDKSTFEDNTADHFGGGISSGNSVVTIRNSTFTHNTADGGGAVYLDGGSLAIDHTTMSANDNGNTAYAGIFVDGGGTVTVKHSTFS